ncbi:MAG: chromate transporter [Clostridiales bacterium]|nr:chromate transporter [Clostridiales bacterium]
MERVIVIEKIIEKDAKLYLKLFTSTFTLSAFTLGGGYVIVPLMRKKFVQELGWIEEKEMLDYVALAQSTPGPIAVNTSILVGFRIAGVLGALLTVLGTVLPPLIIISLVFFLYDAFSSNAVVNAALLGMRIGVAAVLLDVVVRMIWLIVKEKNLLSIFILLASFVALQFFNVSIVLIIALAALIGAAETLIKSQRERGQGSK